MLIKTIIISMRVESEGDRLYSR